MANLIGVATSTRGPLCKKFPGGRGSALSRGRIVTHRCESFESLRKILAQLNTKQCIVLGYPNNTRAGETTNVGPKSDLKTYEIARVKKNFTQGEFILVDYDYTEHFPCKSASDVHRYMCKLLPDVFQGAGYLAIKSSSSRVLCNAEPLKGTSWHLYYMVDAPKQVKWLADNLMVEAQAKGLAFNKLSTDGKRLLRTVVDLQPLKIGGCGIVYEADPIVEEPYELINCKIRITKGTVVRTSLLKPASKGVGIKRVKVFKPSKIEGFLKKSRALHYSEPYRKLTPADRVVLDDLCMQYMGRNHGTEANPIKCPYSDFTVHPSRVKKALDVLQNVGFIRYKSRKNMRKANLYYLNFDMLYMTPPKDWVPWS